MKQCKACVQTPPFDLPSLKHHGEFYEIEDTVLYVSGPASATHGLMIIYDVFGYYPQTLLAADMLAHGEVYDFEQPPPALNASKQQYKVFMPDFFDGEPCPWDWWPDDSPEREARIAHFCETRGNTAGTVERLLRCQRALAAANPQITSWGLIGYCWGGYVASFASLQGTPFKACAQLHPGFAAEVAAEIVCPVLAIMSVDETEEMAEPFKQALKVKSQFFRFPDQIHGFMSARGQITDATVRRDFEKAYQAVLDFLSSNM